MSGEMTKAELVDKISGEMNGSVTKRQINEMLDALANSVSSAVSQGMKAPLPGLGKLTPTERAARQGRNPQTGASIKIPASKSVKFQPAKPFKDALNR